MGRDRLDGLAFDGDEVARLRPRAETALLRLLVVMREERAGVVCMIGILSSAFKAYSLRFVDVA